MVFAKAIETPIDTKLKGSPGVRNWTPTPSVTIFDILITGSAWSGYCPAFLFLDDISGFYLPLNQGAKDIKERYKKESSQVLRLKAEDYRSQL